MRVVFTSHAVQDIGEISAYLHGEAGEEIALGFLDRIDAVRTEISAFPQAGKLFEHLRPNIRGIGFKPYILFYRIQNDRVEVIRVLHGARDIDTLFLEWVN